MSLTLIESPSCCRRQACRRAIDIGGGNDNNDNKEGWDGGDGDNEEQ